MSENVLVKLLKAYAEEGYTVRVGLNPWRKSSDGPFASLMVYDSLNQLEKLPDSHYVAKSLPLPYLNEYEGKEFFYLIKALKAIVKKNYLAVQLYQKIIAIRNTKNSNLRSDFNQVQYLSTGGRIGMGVLYRNVNKDVEASIEAFYQT